MGQGLNTQSERFIQAVPETTPGVYASGATPIVLSNIDSGYNYQSADVYDELRAPGDNEDAWSSVVEQSIALDYSAAPYYNLFSEAVLQFIMDTPTGSNDATAGGVRTRVWNWAQSGRINRKTATLEEGTAASARRSPYGLVTSVELTSTRGNKGTTRMKINWVGQKAAEGVAMTAAGGTQEVKTLVLTNASGTITITDGTNSGSFPAAGTSADVVAALAAMGYSAQVAGTLGNGATSGTYSGTYTITFQTAGDIPNMTASGTGVTSPLATTTNGVAGNVVTTPADPLPVLPNHLKIYRSATYAGLGTTASFVGTADELMLKGEALVDPKFFLDRSDTYSAHTDGKSKWHGSFTLPTDSAGHCAAMQTAAKAYVSGRQWLRFEFLCADGIHALVIDMYVSVNAPRAIKYNGNTEEMSFAFTLKRNWADAKNLVVTTRAAA